MRDVCRNPLSRLTTFVFAHLAFDLCLRILFIDIYSFLSHTSSISYSISVISIGMYFNRTFAWDQYVTYYEIQYPEFCQEDCFIPKPEGKVCSRSF